MEQLSFEVVEEIQKEKDNKKYLKQKWRNKLQEYCDNQAITIGNNTGWCVCGNMNFCDYCEHCGKKNGCVKAIVEYCKENHIEIDYTDYDFEKLLEKTEKLILDK